MYLYEICCLFSIVQPPSLIVQYFYLVVLAASRDTVLLYLLALMPHLVVQSTERLVLIMSLSVLLVSTGLLYIVWGCLEVSWLRVALAQITVLFSCPLLFAAPADQTGHVLKSALSCSHGVVEEQEEGECTGTFSSLYFFPQVFQCLNVQGKSYGQAQIQEVGKQTLPLYVNCSVKGQGSRRGQAWGTSVQSVPSDSSTYFFPILVFLISYSCLFALVNSSRTMFNNNLW